MRIIAKGATSQSIYVVVLDSTSTTGARKTGLVFNTSSLTGYYVRNQGSATAITLATLAAANSAYSSGGFKEVDATNMPGVYRVDVPDAAFATGADSVVVTLKGATGMVQVDEEVQLVAINPQDSVRAGMTALPNAAAEAAGGLYTRGSGAGQINQNANGQVDTRTVTMATDVITAAAIQADAIGAAEIANGAIDAATFAAGAIDASAIATDALGALELAAGAATEIAAAVWDEARASHTTAGSFGQGVASVQGNVTGSVASVTGAVGSVTGAVGSVTGAVGSVTGAVGSVTGNVGGNVTGSVGSVATGGITAASIAADAIGASELAADAVAEIADQVWDEVLSGHLTAGTTGAALNGAGSAGDPWGTALPGAYAAGSAGAILGNLDDAVAAVQADTDNIQTRLPAALVSGRMDSSVGAMAAGVVTAAAVATNAIDADALAADAVTEIAAGVAVGSAPTAADNAAAVWNAVAATYNGAGTMGQKLNAAGGAADPLTNTVPGSYAANTAGYALGTLPTGVGKVRYVYTVHSGTDTGPLIGAGVTVWATSDATGSVNLAGPLITNDLSQVTFFLSPGVVYFWRQKPGWSFTNPDQETVV